YGANFACKSQITGQTALYSMRSNHSISYCLNNRDDAKPDGFHDNIERIIRLFTDRGCDINSIDNQGLTVLSYFLLKSAYRFENELIISTLLECGANPNILTKISHPEPFIATNALFMAIKYHWSTEILDCLKRFGVNDKEKDVNGNNILVFSILERQIDSISWLLNNYSWTNDPIILKESIKYTKYFSKERKIIKSWRG
ncbi:2383_t:CDS:1, partial [Acaulospora morrowiae]